DLSSDDVRVYAAATELPEATRQAFEQIASRQAAVSDLQTELANLQTELKQVTDDQARIQANLKSVPSGSDLHKRYLVLLGKDEDQIQQIRVKIDEKQKALAAARQDLADYVAGLDL